MIVDPLFQKNCFLVELPFEYITGQKIHKTTCFKCVRISDKDKRDELMELISGSLIYSEEGLIHKLKQFSYQSKITIWFDGEMILF